MSIKVRDLALKICFPPVKFIEYSPEKKQFTGLFGGPARAVFSVLKDTFRNITVIKPRDSDLDAAGSSGRRLPGCWGSLQTGEADIFLYPSEMPITGLENITQLNSSTVQSGTYMLAPYSANESFYLVQGSPLDSLKTVSLDTWTNIAVMIILFSVLMLYVKLFVYKRPIDDDSSTRHRQDPREEDEALHGQSLLYQVITHMMQFETCDYTGVTVRYVSLLMSIFAFLFITFLSCMITCDKVSTHDIQVFDTYDKILANKSVQPVWIDNLNDYTAYKKAPEGSLQAQLWQQSRAISREEPERPTLMETSEKSIMRKVQNARAKNMVIFLSRIFTRLFMGVVCNILSTDYDGLKGRKDLTLKGRLDEDVPTSLYVFPFSTQSAVGKQADFVLRRFVEAQLFNQPDITHMIETHLAKEVLGERINYNEGYYQCLRFENLPPGESETSSLALVNTGDVFRWWAYGCFVSLIVLLIEHLYHNSHQSVSKMRANRLTSTRHA